MKWVMLFFLFAFGACESKQKKKNALVDKMEFTKGRLDWEAKELSWIDGDIKHLNDMYRITGKKAYADSAIELYDDRILQENKVDSLKNLYNALEHDLKKY